MKKLEFTFLNDEDVLIDEELEYKYEGEYYIFDYDKSTFKFKFGEEIHFVKETVEDIFQIRYSSQGRLCLYTLKEENVTFEIDLLQIDFKIMDKKYIIKYNIESDIEDGVSSTKTIILTI